MSMTSVAGSYGQSVGDQSLTVGVSAGVLTVPADAIGAMITNGAEAIRIRWGNTPPTASVGHYLNPYSVLDLYTSDLDRIKLIRVSGDSVIHVTYFGE